MRTTDVAYIHGFATICLLVRRILRTCMALLLVLSARPSGVGRLVGSRTDNGCFAFMFYAYL
jgi:hypothetical protein